MAGRRLAVSGTVQGVGFRPFVFRLAEELELTGRVWNDGDGVTVEAFGPHARLAELERRLRDSPPPAARVERIEASALQGLPPATFEIAPSRAGGVPRVAIGADLATCAACAAEVADPANRRHRYPFTNCTDCGPRFTIALAIPYDRPATTMARFTMCERCAAEYHDPRDRRYHAQPNACPVCGPRLELRDAGGAAVPGDPLALAGAALRAGRLLAVKGLGGYHLACDATSPAAVAELRRRKRRDEKPLAVMVAGLEAAAGLAELSPAERTLLGSVERPIVLCRRRPGAALAEGLAPGNPRLGLMLPYTPLHHLLLAEAGRPLVMTSGNLSDEPIAFEDGEALDPARRGGRPVPHPRPAHRLALRRLGGAGGGGAAAAAAPLARLGAAAGAGPPRASPAPPWASGRSSRTPAAWRAATRPPSVPTSATSTTSTPTEPSRRRWRGSRTSSSSAPRCWAATCTRSTSRPATPASGPRRWGRGSWRCSTTTPTPPRPWPSTASRGRCWRSAGTAPGSGPTARPGAASCCAAGRSGSSGSPPSARCRWPGGDQAVREPWRVALAALLDAFDGDAPLDLPLFASVPRRRARGGAPHGGRAASTRRWPTAPAGPSTPPPRWSLARPRARHEGQLALALDGAADEAEPGRYPFELDRARAGDRARPAAALAGADRRPAGRRRRRGHLGPVPRRAGGGRGRAGPRRPRRRTGALPVVLTGRLLPERFFIGADRDRSCRARSRYTSTATSPPAMAAWPSARRWWPTPSPAAAEEGSRSCVSESPARCWPSTACRPPSTSSACARSCGSTSSTSRWRWVTTCSTTSASPSAASRRRRCRRRWPSSSRSSTSRAPART